MTKGFNKLKIAVIGLGYVGLPLALELSTKYDVVGFDINHSRIEELIKGIDKTKEKDDLSLYESIMYSSSVKDIVECNLYIVTVPTPITQDKIPDLNPLINASKMIGSILKKDDIVVYESTVYPGVTEEICGEVLEKSSKLRSGIDFYLGYSPERINPGDKKNNITTIIKIVSAQNEEVLEKLADVYGSIVKAGIYKAPTIKVAEAAKVIENTQRDLNISLMNELAVIFERLDIDTTDVINAAGTKWNFLKFHPGLVGGHCIAVDPYYLTYKAEKVGYIPEVILAGRRVNDNMGRFIASTIIKRMIHNNIPIQNAIVSVLGVTFKENVSDIRNSKVIDLIEELKEFGLEVQVIDLHANPQEVLEEYELDLVNIQETKKADIVVLAVPHDEYVVSGWETVNKLGKEGKNIVIDIKSSLDKATKPGNTILWRL